MNRDNVKQVIQELARQNFNQYSEDWVNDVYDTKDIAIGYYENRDQYEVERDAELNITESDYINWVDSEFKNWKETQN
jgi:hypothetical protein